MYAITHERVVNNPAELTAKVSGHMPINGNDRCSVNLKGVLITQGLASRPFKPASESKRLKALRVLSEQITSPPEMLLSVLVQHALELCGAESAGLSLLHEDDKRQFSTGMRWLAY